MPAIRIDFYIETGRVVCDFIGFEGKACDFAKQNLIEKLKDLTLDVKNEKRKDDLIGEQIHE